MHTLTSAYSAAGEEREQQKAEVNPRFNEALSCKTWPPLVSFQFLKLRVIANLAGQPTNCYSLAFECVRIYCNGVLKTILQKRPFSYMSTEIITKRQTCTVKFEPALFRDFFNMQMKSSWKMYVAESLQ